MDRNLQWHRAVSLRQHGSFNISLGDYVNISIRCDDAMSSAKLPVFELGWYTIPLCIN